MTDENTPQSPAEKRAADAAAQEASADPGGAPTGVVNSQVVEHALGDEGTHGGQGPGASVSQALADEKAQPDHLDVASPVAAEVPADAPVAEHVPVEGETVTRQSQEGPHVYEDVHQIYVDPLGKYIIVDDERVPVAEPTQFSPSQA